MYAHYPSNILENSQTFGLICLEKKKDFLVATYQYIKVKRVFRLRIILSWASTSIAFKEMALPLQLQCSNSWSYRSEIIYHLPLISLWIRERFHHKQRYLGVFLGIRFWTSTTKKRSDEYKVLSLNPRDLYWFVKCSSLPHFFQMNPFLSRDDELANILLRSCMCLYLD